MYREAPSRAIRAEFYLQFVMARKHLLHQVKTNVDVVDVWFVLGGIARYATFVSWANVIVRAIRGEESKEDWRTVASTSLLIGIWTLTSGAKVREMASLRGAAVEMRGLVHEATAQSELRDRQAAERDQHASQQEARMLSFTRWLVALAGLTLAAAIVTLVVAIAH
jgi:hypothetical protein